MKKLLFVFLLIPLQLGAQTLPKVDREFRAVWIATVDNVDFPTKKGLPIDEQKAEIIRDLDLAKSLRLNAVIFQVRPMTDAVYKSDLEPWSEFLTGEMGKSQDFDPLEFIVAEAHNRGILVHAWFNPYRAYHHVAKTISANHVSKTRPDIVRQYGRYMWLDPTSSDARQYTVDVISDVVRRYDVDGVHFDDYFYPYKETDEAGKTIEFPDEANWQAYQKAGGKLTRDDWRRDNVNQLIEAVGRAIKKIKPDVVYGISPFGVWQPIPERDIRGFNAYAELYADARKWLRDGTVDYLTPQLYWETVRKGLSFPVLLDWWKEQNTMKRFVWPGIAAYQIGSTPTFTSDEIASQIASTRRDPLTDGAIYFSFKSLRNDIGGIQAKLRREIYPTDAVIPEFTWIKGKRPRRPKITATFSAKRLVQIHWKAAEGRKPFWFVVYIKDQDGWSYELVPASKTYIDIRDRWVEKYYVTSVDSLGRESSRSRR